MRVYPKGCRWHVVANAVVSELHKTTQPKRIEQLNTARWRQGDTHWVVVQPRGKRKWWLFEIALGAFPVFIAAGDDPDPLIMRAILEVR